MVKRGAARGLATGGARAGGALRVVSVKPHVGFIEAPTEDAM